MKMRLWLVVGILIIGGGGLYILNSYIYDDKQGDDASESRYMDIDSYVRNSISELSPVKEQLGGTFYVTALETKEGVGVVSYEDGHNAYTADFVYTVDEGGKPTILSFKIRP